MKKSKLFRYVLTLTLLMILSYAGFQIYQGYIFARGVTNAAKTIVEGINDLQNNKTQKIDSIQVKSHNQLRDVKVDSLSNTNNTNSSPSNRK